MQKTNQQTIVAEDGDTASERKNIDNSTQRKTLRGRAGRWRRKKKGIEGARILCWAFQSSNAPISITARAVLLYIYRIYWLAAVLPQHLSI